MSANVYIDGFNLYYGCLKGSPYRWLNLMALCQELLPGTEIGTIRYFTALIKARGDTDQGPARQAAYLGALRSIPDVQVHLGTFVARPTRMYLADPPPPPAAATVKVIKTEEKGSDVNLATYLLADAFREDCTQAVVITNDSDLAEPMRMVREELKLDVGLINPHPGQASKALMKTSPTFVKSIRPAALLASQFPPVVEVTTPAGTIRPYTKPTGW